MTIELAPGDTPARPIGFQSAHPPPRQAGLACLHSVPRRPVPNHGLPKSSTLDAIPNYREESQFENVASRRQLPAQTMCRRLDRCT